MINDTAENKSIPLPPEIYKNTKILLNDTSVSQILLKFSIF